MKKFILGRKIGMSQMIDPESGEVVAVTFIKAEDCSVLEVRTEETHGYKAVVIGAGEVKEQKVNKPKNGHFKKLGIPAKKTVKEFRVESLEGYESKNEVKVDQFEVADKVNVRSKTIGRGFSGVIKRHGFQRGPESHGSKSHRQPGSIGGGTSPGHVMKGKKMPGHFGDDNVVIQNLSIVKVDSERNILILKGAIPGKKNNLVEVFQAA